MNPESAITHFIIAEPRDAQPEDDGGEQFWGEILERTCSMDSVNYSKGISKQEQGEAEARVSGEGI